LRHCLASILAKKAGVSGDAGSAGVFLGGDMKRKPVPLLIAVFAAALLFSGSAAAKTMVWVVDDDGQDCVMADFNRIQDAVNAASAGDTILVCAGTYHERVSITKDDLTLRGKGPTTDVIVDADLLGHGLLLNGASGVTVEGFTVREGHDNDVFLVSANRNIIRGNVLTAAVHDPIELANSDDNLIEHNLSIDNLAANACGINLAVGSDRNIIRHNTLINNEWGIQIAGSNDNVIFHNQAINNRGNGIRNVGASSGTVIESNRVFDNGQSPGPFSVGTNAGIRLANGTGLLVARNEAFGNAAVDIRQETAVATFENNHCDTSLPPGLCEHDDGNGH
jgi:parallel beta-helix repeat protein